jgi:hypothetical protein
MKHTEKENYPVERKSEYGVADQREQKKRRKTIIPL